MKFFNFLLISAIMAIHTNAAPNNSDVLEAIGRAFLAVGRTLDRVVVSISTGQDLDRGSYAVDNTNSTGIVAALNNVTNSYLQLGKIIDEIVVKATGLDNNNGTDGALYANDNSGLPAIVAALDKTVKAAVCAVAQVLGTPEGNTTACLPATLANSKTNVLP